MVVITRAQTLTNQKKKLEYFSDFMDNFDKSPLGPELARVTNEKAVTQALRNLIFTNFGERPYQPNLGCNVLGSLFELSGVVLENMLRDAIVATIQSYEPRVVLENVIIHDMNNPIDYSQPASVDKNGVEVSLIYYLANNPTPLTLTILLRKVR